MISYPIYVAGRWNSFEGRDNLKKTYGIYRLIYINGAIISREFFNDGGVRITGDYIIG
jgi:hypothetical protein